MNQGLQSHPEYSNRNEYCSIRTRLPENPDTKRAVIILPGLMYRGWIASGDMDTIVREKNHAAHIHFDYPKTEFVIDKVLDQLQDYLNSCPYDEVVMVGISFGDMVYRHLMNRLSDEQKAKIKHHVSINGLATKDELSLQFKTMLLPANLKSKVVNDIIGAFGLFNRKIGGLLTRDQVYNKSFKKKIKESSTEVDQLLMRQKHHQQAAANGFTPGYADRARVVASDTDMLSTNIPTSIIYSTNDEFFANPEKNAHKIGDTIDSDVQYYEVEEGRHQGLVEYPEKYNPVLENIFDTIRTK